MTKYARKNGLKQAETQEKRKYVMNAESQNLCRKTEIKEKEKEQEQQYNTIKKTSVQKKFLQNDESQMI